VKETLVHQTAPTTSVPLLSPRQQRILDHVRGGRTKPYNGQSKTSIDALVALGLIRARYDTLAVDKGGAITLVWQITVTAVRPLTQPTEVSRPGQDVPTDLSGAVAAPAGPRGKRIVSSGTEDGVAWATCSVGKSGRATGYALIPLGHPWHPFGGPEYDEISGVDVHGRLTYGDGDGWIGFDVNHTGDQWTEAAWTEAKVAAEARSLARQIAAAA